jgi:hypothetical protein
MFQSVEVSGARNKGFDAKDFQNLNSVAIKFNSSAEWWGKSSSAFADNVETQLMKIGLDTFKYGSSENYVVTTKTQSVRSLATSLRSEGVQALVSGTVTGSYSFSNSFANSQGKVLITEVSFSIVSTTNGKTMASTNLSYKNGVSSIDASKDIAVALKALINHPDMDIDKAFEKIKEAEANKA